MRRILHIGTHKTATTSLQTALYNNRHSLAEQGVIYPNLVDWDLRQRAGHHGAFPGRAHRGPVWPPRSAEFRRATR